MTLDSFVNKVIPHSRQKQYQLNLALTELVIMESLPFNIVSSFAFRKFLNQIDPAFVMPSNKYIKTIITEEYNKGVKNLKSCLNSTCEYISITTIVVSQNCFFICQNILAHFGFPIFPILMDIKKPPSILAIESKNSNNFGYNWPLIKLIPATNPFSLTLIDSTDFLNMV